MAIGRFEVHQGHPVQVTVTVGDGQPGGIAIRLGKTALVDGVGSLAHDLGAGELLRGHTLLVDVAAPDSHGATDWVSARLVLRTNSRSIELEDFVEADQGVPAMLSFSVRFY